MEKAYEKLLQYCLFLLARKRYTVSEMQKKLEQFAKKREMDTQTVPQILNRLIELKYLNDEQYAENFISNRVQFRPKGIYLIKKELERKGVLKPVIEAAINENDINELEMAEKLLAKKMKSWQKFEARKIREKSFMFLSSRGFKPDTIYKAVGKCYDLSVSEDL